MGVADLMAALCTDSPGVVEAARVLGAVVPAGIRPGGSGVQIDLGEDAGWLTAFVVGILVAAMRAMLTRHAGRVARAAHEVRGPLFAAGLALHDAAGDPRRVAVAEQELRRAGLALDDLAQASRGRRATELHTVVDAREVAAEVVDGWSAVAARFGAGVRLDVGPGVALVCVDRFRLAQAIANLIVNAAEHGEGDVVVRVFSMADAVRIAVADHGAGPAPAQVAAAGRSGRRRGRRGHGLSVVADVAARHGGRLFVEPAGSAADGLASVVIELPSSDAPPSSDTRRWGPFEVKVWRYGLAELGSGRREPARSRPMASWSPPRSSVVPPHDVDESLSSGAWAPSSRAPAQAVEESRRSRARSSRDEDEGS